MTRRENALLLSSDSDDEQSNGDKLSVNEEYARRLEYNKRREELHRLQAKHPEVVQRLSRQAVDRDVLSEEDDSHPSDDDEAEDATLVDAQFLAALTKIKRRDATIYDPEQRLFPEPDSSEARLKDAQPAQRPTYLKDVVAAEALAMAAAESLSSDQEEDYVKKVEPTYVQEQADLKRSFLQAVEEERGGGDRDDFGGVLRKRRRRDPDPAATDAAPEVQQLLNDYFGQEEQLDDKDRFLKEFILNKGWVEREGATTSFEDLAEDYEEDEAYLETADQFEAKYNFRYEEPGSAQVISYPRQVEGTLRKADERRKRHRTERAERKAAELQRQQDEIKRLKNLKKHEIQDRLSKITESAGKAAPAADVVDAILEGDFDPAEYDRSMAQAFGDDYYQEDEDVEERLEAELGRMAEYSSGEEEAREGFQAVHARLGMGVREAPDGEALVSDAVARERADVQRILEEYYKLDCEDRIGSLACRFHYKPVPIADYGLKVEDIISLSDKDLNQVVGMRRLAPYREDGGLARPNYGKLKQLSVGKASGRKALQSKRLDRHRSPGKQFGPPGSSGAKPVAHISQEDAERDRLQTFAKPSLRRDSWAPGIRSKPAEPQQAAQDGLTRAQRKNWRRAKKRAAKQQSGDVTTQS